MVYPKNEPTRKETLEALRKSIAKWKRLSEGRGVDRGHDNCALCALFCPGRHALCGNCPVREYSGWSNCQVTPYGDWLDAERVSGQMPKFNGGMRPTTARLRKAALQEYKYLLEVRKYFKENS